MTETLLRDKETNISLRDYFAAAAITGWLTTDNKTIYRILAQEAYDLADEMIKARGEKP